MDRERLKSMFSSTPLRETNGVFDFLTPEERSHVQGIAEEDRENAFKNFFKKWPRFYERLTLIVSPILFTGLTARSFINRFPESAIILNVGSGPSDLGSCCVNVDLYAFPNVQVLAMADRLPFRDSSFDGLVCDQVLEHVPNPQAVLKEITRVVKPGGLVYLGVPFMFPLHPSPKDYARWSVTGAETLLPGFVRVESGASIGPTSGLLTVFADWLALVFSFGIPMLRKVFRYFFMIALFPFKYLDLLFSRYSEADAIAAAVYVVARKS